MCLVLKLVNGKVVSIANEQNHRAIQSSTVLVYRLHKYNFYCPTLTTYTHQLTIEYSYGTLSLIWLPKKTLEYEIVLLVTAVILLSSRRILFDFSSKI